MWTRAAWAALVVLELGIFNPPEPFGFEVIRTVERRLAPPPSRVVVKDNTTELNGRSRVRLTLGRLVDGGPVSGKIENLGACCPLNIIPCPQQERRDWRLGLDDRKLSRFSIIEDHKELVFNNSPLAISAIVNGEPHLKSIVVREHEGATNAHARPMGGDVSLVGKVQRGGPVSDRLVRRPPQQISDNSESYGGKGKQGRKPYEPPFARRLPAAFLCYFSGSRCCS